MEDEWIERIKTRSNIDKLACPHNDAVTTQESSRVKTAAAARAGHSTQSDPLKKGTPILHVNNKWWANEVKWDFVALVTSVWRRKTSRMSCLVSFDWCLHVTQSMYTHIHDHIFPVNAPWACAMLQFSLVCLCNEKGTGIFMLNYGLKIALHILHSVDYICLR